MALVIKATQKFVRTSSDKLKYVVDAVKGLPVAKMQEELKYLNKDAGRRLLQTLDQAVANAKHNHGIAVEDLEVVRILVLRGPHYKRMRAVSRGQGHSIIKRTAHIVVELKQVENKKETKKAVEAPKAEVKTEAKKEVVKKTTKKVAAKKKSTKEVNESK